MWDSSKSKFSYFKLVKINRGRIEIIKIQCVNEYRILHFDLRYTLKIVADSIVKLSFMHVKLSSSMFTPVSTKMTS